MEDEDLPYDDQIVSLKSPAQSSTSKNDKNKKSNQNDKSTHRLGERRTKYNQLFGLTNKKNNQSKFRQLPLNPQQNRPLNNQENLDSNATDDQEKKNDQKNAQKMNDKNDNLDKLNANDKKGENGVFNSKDNFYGNAAKYSQKGSNDKNDKQMNKDNQGQTNKQKGKLYQSSSNQNMSDNNKNVKSNNNNYNSNKGLESNKNKGKDNEDKNAKNKNLKNRNYKQPVDQVPADLFTAIEDDLENDYSDESEIVTKKKPSRREVRKKKEQTKYYNDEDDFEYDENDNAQKTEEEEEEEEEEEDADENDDSSLRLIATELLNEESFADHITGSLEFFNHSAVTFLTVGQTFEDAQRNYWFIRCHKYLEAQNIGNHGNYMFAYNDMTAFVKNVIAKHRFIESSAVSTLKTRIAICGPHRSGKSTLLSMFADQILIEMAVTGNWKNTAFFFWNMFEACPLFSDFKLLYLYVIEFCIRSMTIQRPELGPHYELLVKYFSSIFDYRNTPKLKKNFSKQPQFQKFSQSCEAIAQLFISLWNNSETHIPFLTMIFQLPCLIASAAGFSNVFMFIDNIEYSNVFVYDDIQDIQQIQIHDVVNILLERTNYIISCEDQEEMFQTLDEKTEIISTSQLQAQTGYTDSQFIVNFTIGEDLRPRQAEFERVTLTSSYCGEIPAFVSLWETINSLADDISNLEKEMESNKPSNENNDTDELLNEEELEAKAEAEAAAEDKYYKQKEEKEEMEEALNSLIQNFVNNLVFTHDGEKLKVVSVRRSNK
ncbi:hypothetical protein TRFO_38936 [Tritrichomonas foetus]|uniref:Uncharacterized protein n=1 Tax=Tritrichomonas foetus TaxID=1144522 RepID=A0A1J4JCC7_9EUKA|nr:hypothetical protein TRFO_38936 [Tritrichomonas foetus]|eukprot:OHS94916.1 hypothetical protein TRFO_38936 [Tritrichomonas foetus]